MKTIGIDIGTTSVSAVLYDTSAKHILRVKSAVHYAEIPMSEGHSYQDPEVLIAVAQELLDSLLESAEAAGEKIDAIGLTGQMHGILYTDQNGRSVSPLYTWQDGTAGFEIDGQTTISYIEEKTGLTALAGYGLVTHIVHLRDHSVPEEAVSLCTVMDYFGMVLTGRTSPLMHMTNAASLGLYDAKRHRFCEEALKVLGVDSDMIPEVTERMARLGSYLEIPVLCAIGDNQATFLACVGDDTETALVNIGTGAQVTVLCDEFLEGRTIETRPFLCGKYILAGSTLAGGKAYSLLEDFFREFMVAAGAEDVPRYELLNQLAEFGERRAALTGNQVTVKTTFLGTRENPGAKASIEGLTPASFTPDQVAYGTLDGIAAELADVYRRICELTGKNYRRLILSGNAVRRNDVLIRCVEKHLQAEGILCSFEEEGACGAAISCMRL